MLLFMKVLFTQFIAEMGDKTQLMLVAMTSRFKLKDILLGTGVAVLVLNGLAVLAGGIISTVVPTWLIRLIAGAAFLFFAVTTLKGDDDEEENVKDRKIKLHRCLYSVHFLLRSWGIRHSLPQLHLVPMRD